MKNIWFAVYNVVIVPILWLVIYAGGIFNSKIKKGIKGRKRLFEELILSAASLDKSKKIIWFHSSSLGEFEQAKPIIQELKKRDGVNILVTFFSPSGYENSKKYPFADLVSYIPFDSKSNAEKFIKIINPSLAVLMRYDIWPNHVWALKNNGINTFLVDATMKEGSKRKWPAAKSFHKSLFKDISEILTVSEDDKNRFIEFGIPPSSIKPVGDTRFDRVYQRAATARQKHLINENHFINKKILVAGSTWEQDEDILFPAFIKLAEYDKNAVLIIAPHEPTILHLEKIENEFRKFQKTIRFSYMNNYDGERVIIVDSIGILLTLYTYAHAAFVGGSFKQNVHNVLEAAVYGIPVIMGPKIYNSQEAKELANKGGGIIVQNQKQMYRNLRMLFMNESLRKEKGEISLNYVEENLGATSKILNEIYKSL